MKKHVKFEYNKINPYIYLGTNACCEIHFKDELLKKGIRGDISLEIERIDNPIGVDYFLWLPTKDKTAPTPRQLWVGVKAMEVLLKQKVKIYLHCKNGHGRAPTLLAAYFLMRGMKINEAIKLIKSKRPEIHLNKKQTNALKKFKQYLKKKHE